MTLSGEVESIRRQAADIAAGLSKTAHRSATIAQERALLRMVGVDGLAHDFKLIKGLGYGLDEAAVTAVSQWHFEAGQRNGVPVPVAATIEVNFRMLQAP